MKIGCFHANFFFFKEVSNCLLLGTEWVTDIQRMESSLDLGSWECREAVPEEEELELDTQEREKLHRDFKYENRRRKFGRRLGESS